MSTGKKSKLLPFILCIATGVVSGLLLLKSYDFLNETLAHERDWPKVEATVTGFDTRPGRRGTLYTPIFSFTTKEGKPVCCKSGISASPPSYKVDEKTELHYNPAEPTEIMETGFCGKYLSPLIILIFSLVSGIVSSGIYFIFLRKK